MAGGEAARAAELSELLLTHFSHRLDKVAGACSVACSFTDLAGLWLCPACFDIADHQHGTA